MSSNNKLMTVTLEVCDLKWMFDSLKGWLLPTIEFP